MPRNWRDFEKLVARIERRLAPSGVMVKSPDRLPDRVTGTLREVDASIRYQIGSVPILITVECRDRQAVRDITWLEQIKSKRDSIRANQTIAVSREGFADNAIRYALVHGIELRVLSDMADHVTTELLRTVTVSSERIGWSIHQYSISVYPNEDYNRRIDDHAKVLRPDQLIAYNSGSNAKVSLNDIVRECLTENDVKLNLEELLRRYSEICVILRADFEPNSLIFSEIADDIYIKEIALRIVLFKEKVEMPLRPVRYLGATGKVIYDCAESYNELVGGIQLELEAIGT